MNTGCAAPPSNGSRKSSPRFPRSARNDTITYISISTFSVDIGDVEDVRGEFRKGHSSNGADGSLRVHREEASSGPIRMKNPSLLIVLLFDYGHIGESECPSAP